MKRETIEVVKQFEGLKILVVGDIMIDHYIEGDVNRICPEAPVPIMNKESSNYGLGGAGNVAVYLSELGADVSLYGQVGGDLGKKVSRSEWDWNNINYIGEIFDNYPTTIKNRAISKDNKQIVFRWDEEEIRPLNDFNKDVLEVALSEVDAVIISDYGKGVVTPQISEFIIKRHKNVIVDPKHGPWHHFRGALIIKPNKKEFESVFGNDGHSLAGAFVREHGTNILTTLGDKGMMAYLDKPFAAIHIPTEPKEVMDVTGAGDMVSAVLAMSVAAGLDIVESAKLANLAAGIKVSQLGTGSVGLHDLLDEIIDKNKEDKIYYVDQGDIFPNFRNKKVVFTNGCFDLIHNGHIELLKKAKEKGDVLVVGMNSDDSVRELKGENRPIQNENVRSIVLSSIKHVDAVIVFNENTPLELIKAIKPDVLVKGSDYSVDEIVGSKEVIESGGEVITVDIIEGSSTSSIVEKISSTSVAKNMSKIIHIREKVE